MDRTRERWSWCLLRAGDVHYDRIRGVNEFLVEGMGGRIVIEKQGIQFSWGTGVYR